MFLSQLIGPTLLILALGMMANHERYEKLYKEMDKHGLTVFMIGVATTVLGLAMVLKHNLWGSAQEVIISFIGWAALVKGVALFAMPKQMTSFAKDMSSYLQYGLLVWLVVGGYLTWLGYFA